MKRVVEAKLKAADEVIELKAFGLATGMDPGRPVMLFREKDGEDVLPVWLAPVDAGIALTQYDPQTFAISPHDIPLSVLSALGVKLQNCRFCEIVGHQQYVELEFSGSDKLANMRVRADHAISFCLQAGARFYCTREYLAKAREVDAQLGSLNSGLARKPDLRRNPHPYLN